MNKLERAKLKQKIIDERVHLSHCNQGEYLGSCKYGEHKTCPALKKQKLSITLTLEISEAKTISELRNLTRTLLQTGAQHALIGYKILNFKFNEKD